STAAASTPSSFAAVDTGKSRGDAKVRRAPRRTNADQIPTTGEAAASCHGKPRPTKDAANSSVCPRARTIAPLADCHASRSGDMRNPGTASCAIRAVSNERVAKAPTSLDERIEEREEPVPEAIAIACADDR